MASTGVPDSKRELAALFLFEFVESWNEIESTPIRPRFPNHPRRIFVVSERNELCVSQVIGPVHSRNGCGRLAPGAPKHIPSSSPR